MGFWRDRVYNDGKAEAARYGKLAEEHMRQELDRKIRSRDPADPWWQQKYERQKHKAYDPWHDTIYRGQYQQSPPSWVKAEEEYAREAEKILRDLREYSTPAVCTYSSGFCPACDREHKYTVLDPGEPV